MGEAAEPFTMNDVHKLLGNPQLIRDMSVKELLRVDNECGQWYFYNRSSTSPTDSESINSLIKSIVSASNLDWFVHFKSVPFGVNKLLFEKR
jgi:hypothetical protein